MLTFACAADVIMFPNKLNLKSQGRTALLGDTNTARCQVNMVAANV